ncbi:hypothetical protein IFR04_004178 [Cadophora malorum]|uniref:Oxidase ustYa n=1 Tax=Cadophora malorum TaxID=108018 RepID=A0A8H7WD99_9HELO|nr:hypothetical protein IFR04_004178 [Cadophora malorum]
MSTRYSPVGERENFRDGRDEDVFSDIETSMTVDEKSTHLPKAKGWKSRCTIAITILVATALPIAFMATLAALRRTYTTDSPVPRLPTEGVVFGNYSEYSAAPTIENNVKWMDLLGPGMGFVSIKNPSQYGLPDGISNPHMTPNVQNYGVSMYHQLHCLMMIRTLYWQALRGDRNLMMEENDGLEEEMGHVNHCFDYIRQGIMCAGDMSMEGAADQGDSQGPHISGIGMKHECKSWEASRKWMDENLPAR